MSFVLNTGTVLHLPKTAESTAVNETLTAYRITEKLDTVYDADDFTITAGEYTPLPISEEEFVINVTESGLFIKGLDYPSLMRGLFKVLNSIKCESDGSLFIEESTSFSVPRLGFRCAHLCIFPETELPFFKKCVRSCALSGYTHIIFEFWGMLKFDCLPELAWPFAYSKDEIREIVSEANALGVEIIPMFNHLGHASACREANGKHVVLDQAPQYEYMFDSHGWVWNYKRDDVYALLRRIREELIEVCGEGKYFHLGCDEAYGVGYDIDAAESAAEYLNKISAELTACGRRGIIWGDMLLSREEFPDYELNSSRDVSDLLIKKLDKNLIIADWQYAPHGEIWKTSKHFSALGFDVVCCPWQGKTNIDEAISTAEKNNLFGIIQTTWHQLHGEAFKSMVYGGIASYSAEYGFDDYRFYCAHIARKASPPLGEYEKCGWSPKMTGPGL